MMVKLLLLDLAPDPVSTGVGLTALILIGIVVLIIVALTIIGFVFLLRRFLRARPANASVQVTRETTPNFQPSNPNQL